jgi:hypothetical protein
MFTQLGATNSSAAAAAERGRPGRGRRPGGRAGGLPHPDDARADRYRRALALDRLETRSH